MGTDGFRVPPERLSVTEPARGRMGRLLDHTAGPNNTYSTGQTVSQNNFIVPKIEVESKAETRGGEGGREGREVEKVGRKKRMQRERERESGGLWENWGTGKGGVPEKVQSRG